MKRKIVSSMLVLTLAVGMLAGCGNKEAEVKDVSVAETKTENVTFNTTKLANVIAGDPVKLSDLLYEVVPDKKQEVKAVTLTYGNANITVEDGKEWKADTKETKDPTFLSVNQTFNAKNVPEVTFKFKNVTKTPTNLNVSVSLTDKAKKTSKADIDIKIMVLPETVKPVKAITENLKLSESLKDYDFEVRAKNIAEKAVETIESIRVTKSNVKFEKVGHYEVTYEIKTKPSGKLDVPTDVSVVDKSQELSEDNVITENVKPGETIEVTTGVDVVDKKTESTLPKDSVITDSKDTTAPPAGSTSTGDSNASDNKGDADKGNSGSSDNGNAGGDTGGSGNSGGGSADSGNTGGGGSSDSGNTGGGGSTPTPPPHSHSWTAHTATRNVWVPNIVTVTDYENQAAHRCDARCNDCGALFDSQGACADHLLSAGHAGYQNIACSHITQVATGSHTEDHGYNTTESYTDYNYCSCGATQ